MLCSKEERLTTHCVFEFQKGGLKNHWQEGSIYLDNEIFSKSNLYEILDKSINNFNCYGPNKITKNDWNNIKKASLLFKDEITKMLIQEIDEWAKDCFVSETYFRILGP